MSSCLSGGGRAYKLNLDLIKSPTSFSGSNSSTPSSTLSESTNSPLSIFTRKARTPRKRPNQTYNEAAALLSTAYPKIFPLTKPFKFRKSQSPFLPEPSDLLHCPTLLQRPSFSFQQKGLGPLEKPCQSPGEVCSQQNYLGNCDEHQENIDAESMLDKEIEEGIDSILGNLTVGNESINHSNSMQVNTCCYGYPVGLGFGYGYGYGYGMRRELRAIRNVDEDWWRFPCVNLADISQKFGKIPVEKEKKKKKKKKNLANTVCSEEHIVQSSGGLLLKLNYDDVLNEWSGKGSPFSDDAPGAELAWNDVQERLAQIDLFPEKGVERGAIVLRYKEKRRTRLLSKNIRYQVRKVNTDQRPRLKGRFVRREKSGDDN